MKPSASSSAPPDPPPLYGDRHAAGEALAECLLEYRGTPGLLVLGLPRGGVPVAAAVARRLGGVLDIHTVRKLGVPGHEELAMGAIASGGVRVRNEDVLRHMQDPKGALDRAAEREGQELERREKAYRGGRPRPDLRGRVVIAVDDGLATGATMRAALLSIRQSAKVARLVAAAPVGTVEACQSLKPMADQVVCARIPEDFHGVGGFYRNFDEVSDEEVRQELASANSPSPAQRPSKP
ncbi:MAG: Protein-L-isoaspartate O-methyltransferase [Verrucomicrobiales bacterium]|nr:Protein-L-isoaspartate O-methyltransferase [Verrucomicrobiales bacterium]